MKKIKVERAVYAAWDYELELEHLNEMSEKGWQLIRGGCFHTKYERDDSVVYRYQLDHNANIENRMRYIDTFREQGWEYINSTFNGWHYFRKAYDPKMPAEEYEIYSDRPSREEMAGRLGKLMTVLAAVIGLMFAASIVDFICEPNMAMIGIIAEMLAVLTITVTGAVRMRGVGRGEKSEKKFPIAALVTVAVIGLAWFVVFASAEQMMTMQNSSGSVETEFQMRLPDWVNFSAECESALWMQMEINAKDGEDIISDSAAAGEAAVPITREWNVFLMPGEYNVSVKCDSETSLMLKID